MKLFVKKFAATCCFLVSASLLIICLTSWDAAKTFEDHVTSGNYADAISIYNDKIFGNSNKEVEAKNFIREYMGNALEDYATGTIGEADVDAIFNCLIKLDDELYILNVDLGRAIEQYTVLQMSKEKYEQAVSEMMRESYDEAANLFAGVDESDIQNYEEARQQFQLCNSAIYEKTDSSITRYIADEQYELAIKEFEQFIQKHEELVESDMNDKIADCKTKYRNQIIEKSIDLYHSHGAAAANIEINKGLQLLPDDAQLVNVGSLYLSVSEPVSFNHLTGSEEGASLYGSDKIDSLGKKHSGNSIIYFLNLSDWRPTASIERNIYGDYSKLTGHMYFLDTSFDMKASMQIYVDEIIAFESGTLDKKTGGIDFDIDISGAYIVKIEISYVDVGSVYSHCFLDDVVVSRELSDEDIYQAALA